MPVRMFARVATASWLCALATAVWAAPPTDTLLPNSTKGYFVVADYEQFRTSWNQTQLGQLLDQPEMKAFVEDLDRQLKEKWTQAIGSLGIELDDLATIAAGEVAGGFVGMPEGMPATVMLVNVRERNEAVDALLGRIQRQLVDRGGTKTTKKIGEIVVTVYDLSEIDRGDEDPDAKHYVEQVAYFVRDDMLCASSRLDVAQGILARFEGEPRDSLKQLPAYTAVVDRCRQGAADLEPQARWFIEPLGMFEAIRRIRPPTDPEGTDLLKVMKNQGFAAIRGIGGFINFCTGDYDLLHRTAVFAPPPYEKAMRMLVFPNTGELGPQNWVPPDVATYASLSWDMKNAFERASTLFDELFGEGEEGVFEDTLDSIRDDPNGPGIDVRKDLIAHIGNRATILIDYQLPITTTSERMLFAAETINEAALTESLRKSMEGDPTVTRREFQGYVIWEIVEEEAPAPPTVELDGALALGDDGAAPLPVLEEELGPDGEMEEEEAGPLGEGRLLSSSAITVAHGQIFIATQTDFLERVLQQISAGESLANMADYQRVQAEFVKLGATETSVQVFRRTEDEHQATYELLKQGKMPESQTMLGKLLNRLWAVPEGEVREAELDASSLPDYEKVRPYLGPAGLFVVSEENGWFATGFTLRRTAE